MNIKTFFFLHYPCFSFQISFYTFISKTRNFPPHFMVRSYVNAVVNLVMEVDLGRSMAEELSITQWRAVSYLKLDRKFQYQMWTGAVHSTGWRKEVAGGHLRSMWVHGRFLWGSRPWVFLSASITFISVLEQRCLCYPQLSPQSIYDKGTYFYILNKFRL